MAHMATNGGLRRLFEKPLPENPTLLEALSAWNHAHRSKKPVDPASFTEIFGELHFQEKPDVAARGILPPPPPRAASWVDVADAEKSKDDTSLDALLKPKPTSSATVKRSASFCMKRSESLLLCTEGLGSESTVDADDMVKPGDDKAAVLLHEEAMEVDRSSGGDMEAAGAAAEAGKEQRLPFPPPIRSIGRGGKPCVCFRSFRAEGRFVLMEVVIPGNELLQASREDGRLRLQFAATAAGGVGVEEEMELGEDIAAAAKNICIDEIELSEI